MKRLQLRACASWLDDFGPSSDDPCRTMWREVIKRALRDWRDLFSRLKAVRKFKQQSKDDAEQSRILAQREIAILDAIAELDEWFTGTSGEEGSLMWIVQITGWPDGTQETACKARGMAIGRTNRVETRTSFARRRYAVHRR